MEIYKYICSMQKNENVKNVKEYVQKVNIYMKNYKITSNRNVKPNMKISKYIEMHLEEYLFEIINEYIKNRNYKNM